MGDLDLCASPPHARLEVLAPRLFAIRAYRYELSNFVLATPMSPEIIAAHVVTIFLLSEPYIAPAIYCRSA